MMDFQAAALRARNNLPLTCEQARAAVDAPFADLLFEARRVRRAWFGTEVEMCAILNARCGACAEDCAFCAQSSVHETNIEEHPVVAPEVCVSAYNAARSWSCHQFGVVTSGRSVPAAERARLFEGLRAVGADGVPALCASLGEMDGAMLDQLAAAGVTRIHHNLETSRRFFPEICTTHSFDDRVAMIERARAAGFEVCSGGIFGLGESWDDRIDLAFTLRELNIRSVPINFLVPIPGTPLGIREQLSPREALRIIALYRFILPRATLRIAGGRMQTLRDLHSWIFMAGANAIMTGDGLTTTGRKAADDKRMLRDLGLHWV
jgi:biotin synthase